MSKFTFWWLIRYCSMDKNKSPKQFYDHDKLIVESDGLNPIGKVGNVDDFLSSEN